MPDDNTSFDIDFSESAYKEYCQLPEKLNISISTIIEELHNFPRVRNCKKLKVYENLYRVRVGNFRIVFSIDIKSMMIAIIRIRHRKDV